eukprot:scaffold14552_cov27-Tisochrysis_lutea.AAC.3
MRKGNTSARAIERGLCGTAGSRDAPRPRTNREMARKSRTEGWSLPNGMAKAETRAPSIERAIVIWSAGPRPMQSPM